MNEYLVRYEDGEGEIKECVMFAKDTIEVSANLNDKGFMYISAKKIK